MVFQGTLGSHLFLSPLPPQVSKSLYHTLPAMMFCINQAQRQMIETFEMWAKINLFFCFFDEAESCSVVRSGLELRSLIHLSLASPEIQVCATRSLPLTFQVCLSGIFITAPGSSVMPWEFLWTDLIYGIRSHSVNFHLCSLQPLGDYSSMTVYQ